MIENKCASFEIDDKTLALLSSGLNDEQLKAVKETKNVVVSAGAGSGKTTVLASRYAYLVEAKNVPCEKILTLTFTKKAANEMKERIFNGLKFHQQAKDIKGKKDLGENFLNLGIIKERARKAVENFDKTHIQTLDSYFSEIAKKGAHFYGINPNFTLDDDKVNSKIQSEAIKYVLENLEKEEIRQTAQIFKIQNVAKELFAAAVLKYSTVLTPVDFAFSLEKQKNVLLKDYDIIVEQFSGELSSFIEEFAFSKSSGKTRDKMDECISENGCPEFPALTAEIIENGEASVLFKGLSAASQYFDSYLTQYLRDDCYKKFKNTALPLLEKLYLIANSVSGFPVQKKIFLHLEKFQSEINRIKRVSGLLTFDDVSRLALATLTDHAEIRAIEKQKFDSIMIDEFQDDNQLQCDVLLILCDQKEKIDGNGKYQIPKLSDIDLTERLDTHKLFFVGDDKQSIYRFRKADVSVFRNLSSSIKNSIELKTNYRSSAQLIRSFNTIFGGYDYPEGKKVNENLSALFMTKEKFPPKTDGSERIPDFEADYKRVEVPDFRLEGCDFSKKGVTVALYPKKGETAAQGEPAESDGESEEDRKEVECEASFVAREIKRLMDETDEKGCKKYRYSDFALLFRSSTPTAAYENILLEAGIPYSTEVYKGFFSDGPVNDILSLLKLCVYPQDKNAWAKLLRSPFCGLTFAELEKVLVNTENPYKAPFSPEMLEAVSSDSELSAKILNLKEIYEDIRFRLSREKLTKTISYIWYELGYRFETKWNKSVEMYSSLYDILFEMARLAEGKTQSLASFIDMVKTYEDTDGKLDGLDVVLEGEDAVQILTVHKSKGLEFKVVFVCAASSPAKGHKTSTAFSEEYGFLLKTPSWPDYEKACSKMSGSSEVCKNAEKNAGYFFSVCDEQNKTEECAELRRLAYVAFTRAEEKLYIVGTDNGEFTDEKAAFDKCRQFDIHSPEEKFLVYEKISGKKQELKQCELAYKAPSSFYQLMLPLIFESVCEEGLKNPAIEFVNDLESFKNIKIDEEELGTKADYIKVHDQISPVIEEKLSPKVYVSPSLLKSEGGILPLASDDAPSSATPSAGVSATPQNPGYELINKIVESSVPGLKIPSLSDDGEYSLESADESEEMIPAFSFTDFGTVAHAYMEAKVLERDVRNFTSELLGINEKFIPGVNMEKWSGETNREKKILKIRELCEDMAVRFEKTSLYKEALESEWKKTEYSFRLADSSLSKVLAQEGTEYAEELIVNGQIDLVYKNKAGSPYKYTVVDYKTNQKIEPEIYRSQLDCYRRAVSAMTGCKESEIRCVLYYLRFAEEVEISCR
ncbi:UvrD-helicase domain-containing protein [Treponema sp.]|uniref:UvrD-helicase domain-containing protein n=1 Tax=Treponema sp. TaxID=166 RepID=UPI00388D7467